MKSIFKIFSIFTPKQQRYCGRLVFYMLIGAILEAVGIGAILPLIAILGDEQFLEKHALVREYAEMLHITAHVPFIIFLSSLLIALYVLKNLYMAWLVKKQIGFAMRNQVVYAKELLSTYLSKPYLYHLDQNSTTLVRNITAMQNIFNAMLISTFSLIVEVITAIVIWLMLVMVDSFTAIVVAGVLGSFMYSIMRIFRKNITKQGQIQSEYAARYSKWLYQSLGSIKETKVLRKEVYFITEFDKAYRQFGEANGKFSFINQLPRMFIETLVTSGLLVLIIAKLAMGTPPMEIVPLLGVLALAAFRLMPCANRIVNLYNGIKFQMPFFNIIYDEFLEIKDRRAEDKTLQLTCSKEKQAFHQQIKVENLSFKYPQGKQSVLRDISFTVPKGSFVGIVGQSGAGKTTFVDIMLGLLEPTNGQITVDGENIFQDIRAWQANLSYVPQSIYLIDGTIQENIALGIPEQEIEQDKIDKVLKMAELYDFVQDLPEKSNAFVGERGVKLSGGQRQRIGIARALYYDPEVLILDEATSALDNETEKSITDTILNLKGQITIIAIAHRVSTLTECDFKIKFEDGKVEVIKSEE